MASYCRPENGNGDTDPLLDGTLSGTANGDSKDDSTDEVL